MKHKFEYKVTMTPEQFLAENEEYFQNKRADEHPELAYMINDGELDKFYGDVDREDIKQIMSALYSFWLEDC